MRFRRLTSEEFSEVEPEFIKFLATQGVDQDEWAKISGDSGNTHKLEYLLDEFSTFFWESTTSRITFLERVNPGDRWVFKFSESEAKVIRWTNGDLENDVYKGNKSFPQEARAREIFLLLEQGLLPCPTERHEELDKLFED